MLLAIKTTENQINIIIKDVPKMLDKLKNNLIALAPSIIFALLILIIGILLIKIVLKLVSKMLKKASIDPTATGFVKGLVRVFLNIMVYITVLSILGVPMTSIIAFIGACGLAIGLALQSSLSNLAGGFILLFEKPFKAGDYIETAGNGGTVETIGILYTRIVTPDNKEIYIPNGTVTNSSIVNSSKKPKRRVDLEYAISYGDDYVKAQRAVLEVIKRHDKILQDENITIRVGRHGESGRTLFVRVWAETANYWDVYFDLQEGMIKAFENAGITMPFPQIDVRQIVEN
ncbi:mechanosensitive ion channel protein MscS [Clostridia bacterium]|nr:mechanosensitive ion channel protein MscS [Clostridia bacterium]